MELSQPINNEKVDNRATKPLTVKRQKFVLAKAEGLKNAEAYTHAGYKASNRRVAEVEASKLLKKPSIQDAIAKELRSQKITPERVIKPIADSLEAMTYHNTPDYRVRLKASDMALNLMGVKQGAISASVHFHKHLHERAEGYDL